MEICRDGFGSLRWIAATDVRGDTPPLGDHPGSFLTRGINIEKDYLIHISEANITPLTVYLMRNWVNASLRPKHCAKSSHRGPNSRESLSHQSQRKWLGQIPPALLQAVSGRTLQRWCYLRKAKPRNLSRGRSITHKCNIPRRPR